MPIHLALFLALTKIKKCNLACFYLHQPFTFNMKAIRRIYAIFLLSGGSIFLLPQVCAQQSQADSIRMLFQQLNANQNVIKNLQAQRRNDSLRIAELQKSMQEQVNSFSSAVSSVDIRVREFDQRMRITDRDRYAIIQRNLISSVEVFDMLNQRLNILEALNQLEEYQNILTDLNNPANKKMRFT